MRSIYTSQENVLLVRAKTSWHDLSFTGDGQARRSSVAEAYIFSSVKGFNRE